MLLGHVAGSLQMICFGYLKVIRMKVLLITVMPYLIISVNAMTEFYKNIILHWLKSDYWVD